MSDSLRQRTADLLAQPTRPGTVAGGSETRADSRPSGLWARAAMLTVAAACTALVVNFYTTAYRPGYGLTKLIVFGSALEPGVLPRLRTTRHFVTSDPGGRDGYDGQFYAQLALDPALRRPELAAALDSPGYRARRIGLPVLAWALGLGKARWTLQAYAVANGFFWLLLLAVLLRLLRPWSGRGALCLGGALLGTGTVASVSRALTDLPAASLVFASVSLPAVAGAAALLGAIFVRETSLLALPATLEFRDPLDPRVLWRNLRRVLLAVVPFGLWLLYVKAHFPATAASGGSNFAWPFREVARRLAGRGIHELNPAPHDSEGWQDLFFFDFPFHELVTPLALLGQGLYLAVRPEPRSTVWRVGACYAVLGACLGFAVWEETNAAARALLPMTVAFYLHLAAERRGAVFWPFFVLATLPALHAVRILWLGEP